MERQSDDDVSLEHVLVSYNRSEFSRLGLEIFKRSQYPLVPEWTLFAYLVCVNGIGIILNLIMCYKYVMSKDKKGIYSLIVQIAISDMIALTVVSIPELLSHQAGDWTFGSTICRLYSTFEVFAATSCVYFLMAVHLHSLASANATAVKVKPSNGLEEELLEDGSALRSSQNSLVSRGDTLGRPLNVGHRTKRPNIPVLLPSIFVWILSASLSVPELPLSTVIDSRSGGISMCTFLNNCHVTTMQVLLAVFQLLVPFVVLSATSGMILTKLLSKTKQSEETLRPLRVALFLCCIFVIFTLPRLMLAFAHGLWSDSRESASGLDRFIFPPLNYDVTPVSMPMAFSFLHFMSPLIKPFGYVYFFRKSPKSIPWCSRNKGADGQ